MKKKVFLFLLVIFLAYLIFLIFNINRFYQKVYTPQKKIEEKSKFNFLLFGYGGAQHEGAYLTDTIMVFHLDTKNKRAVLLSIPRDLWVPIPTKSKNHFSAKINTIYQIELFPENYPDVDDRYFGQKKDASFFKYIVGKVIGDKIDYYAGIDFEGFKKAVDALGGVEVEVEKSFVDEQYPIEGKEKDLCGQEEIFQKAEKILNNSATEEEKKELLTDEKINEFVKNATESPHLAFPCRYEKLVFQKGKTKMNGETALKFVRSRHSAEDGNDFARARRQQLFLQAVKDRVLNLNIMLKVFNLLDQLSDHLKTDVDPSLIKKLIQEAKNINQYQLTTYVLTTDNLLEASVSKDGQYILIPKKGENDFFQIWEMFKELISVKDASASGKNKND